MRSVSMVLLGLSLLSACNRKEKTTTESGAEVEQTGEEVSKNPLKALAQVSKAGKELAEKAEEMKNHEPVDPVKFDKLAALLPSPEGWDADEAKGATQQMGEFKISNASRRYTKGATKPKEEIQVNVLDGSYVPMVYAPFTMMTKFAQESTDGYARGIEIDGHPAFEEWKKSSNRAKVIVLIDDRFLLTVQGHHVSPEEVRNWVGLVGTKKVAAVAESGK
jgi:hypothetical protein